MTTLHIDTGVEMRGGQWQALYLLNGLIERGDHVRLLAPARSPLAQAASAQELDVRPLRWTTLAAAARDADLVHAHDAHAHNFAILTGRPAVVSRRVAFPVQQNPASRWKYRRATHFIAVSKCVRQTLIAAGVDPARITVVHDGVPLPEPAQGERTRVVALDLDDPGKGKKLIERAGALAGVAVHFSKNLPQDLPRAALFVYITDLEGLGSAVLLAMAYGVPVLASRVGGLPEIVEDGVTGLLTSNDPAAIAETMRKLLSDRALASQLAARARVRWKHSFPLTEW